MEGRIMKVVKEEKKKGSENKSIALSVVVDAQIQEISKEFSPEQIVQVGKDWICPVCLRPHHKKPGPFTHGATIKKNESTVSLWVQSMDCCRWEQHFPFKAIKERKVNAANLNSVIRRSFYS